MESFYGFDLGDAESAVAVLPGEEASAPVILPVKDAKSFITAYAVSENGETLIGENACYRTDSVRKGLRFKSRFLADPASRRDVEIFASGVLDELYRSGAVEKTEDNCFYVGCPAGWDKNARERYRSIFENAGYPPVRIVSESRAAMVSACRSRHLQVGHDILSKSVLVADIGSSTTDFAYIRDGKEVEMQTAGEVVLGGGIMDEILLEESVAGSGREKELKSVFEQSPPWRTYCEFAARRLKEKYFSDEEFWKNHECTDIVTVYYRKPVPLRMRMNPEMADHLMNKKSGRLGNRSFRETFLSSLKDIRESLKDGLPELVFLTGGVSRLPALREWCESVFPESVVITGSEPEFSVARGLAYCGRIDSEMRAFRAELDELIASSTIENVVESHITELYRAAMDALASPLLHNACVPVFEKWRNGGIRRLIDTDEEMEKAVTEYLHSDEAKEILAKPVSRWLRTVGDDLEEYTMPICIRHNIPYRALSLKSYFNTTDIDIRIEAKDIFAVEEITWLIDSVISVIVGLFCGGSGIALISGGPAGILTGALLSLLVLILGKNQMEKALLRLDIPGPMRRLVTRRAFESRIGRYEGVVKKSFYETLENQKGEEISERLSEEISEDIEQCLTRMAEIVEIPLGQQ